MAQANINLGSLTPAFEPIQQALSERARLALNAPPSSLGTATAVSGAVKDIALEQRKNAEAERLVRLRAELEREAEDANRNFESRFDVGMETEQDLNEAAEAFGMPKETFRPLMGVKFKDQKSAEDAVRRSVLRTLRLERIELEGLDPASIEVPTPGPLQSLATGDTVPVATGESRPRLKPDGSVENFEVATQEGLANNKSKLEELDKKIEALNQEDQKLSGTASVRRNQKFTYFDDVNKVWRSGIFDRISKERFQNPDTDPIVPGPRKFVKDPETEEFLEDNPDLTQRAVTRPESIPPGEKATNIKQFTAKQKRLLSQLETRLEKTDTFKSARLIKNSLGQFKTLLAQDLATVSGALKSLASRSIAGEKGVLTDKDVERTSGSGAILDTWNRNIKLAADGKLDEKSFREFGQVVNTILQRAEILEDAAITDVVQDATGDTGEFQNVDPFVLRERLGAPEATGFVNPSISQFQAENVRDALDNLRRLGKDTDQQTLFNMLLFMESKGKATRRKKKK